MIKRRTLVLEKTLKARFHKLPVQSVLMLRLTIIRLRKQRSNLPKTVYIKLISRLLCQLCTHAVNNLHIEVVPLLMFQQFPLFYTKLFDVYPIALMSVIFLQYPNDLPVGVLTVSMLPPLP